MTEQYTLGKLIEDQIIFEKTREGTDGTLWSHNTIEFGLTRGVIGEAEEALEELRYLYELQVLTPDAEELIKKTYDRVVMEITDVYIFLASVFAHAGLNEEAIMILAQQKMARNEEKYDRKHFKDRTVDEGVAYSRQAHRERIDRDSAGSRTDIHPSGSSGSIFGAEEEYGTGGAGALT